MKSGIEQHKFNCKSPLGHCTGIKNELSYI